MPRGKSLHILRKKILSMYTGADNGGHIDKSESHWYMSRSIANALVGIEPTHMRDTGVRINIDAGTLLGLQVNIQSGLDKVLINVRYEQDLSELCLQGTGMRKIGYQTETDVCKAMLTDKGPDRYKHGGIKVKDIKVGATVICRGDDHNPRPYIVTSIDDGMVHMKRKLDERRELKNVNVFKSVVALLEFERMEKEWKSD